MSDKSGISWTSATWNPVTGCTKVSPACKACYAERDWARSAANPKTVYFGRKFTDVACHPERLDQPLRWSKTRMIFVNSMSDLFHEDIPQEFIDQIFAVMGLAYVMRDDPHIFQVLTKRPARMHAYLNDPATVGRVTLAMKTLGPGLPGENSPPTWPLPNVWLGVSVENQAVADERIPLLLDTPAAVRWISAEPLLAPLSIAPWIMREADRLPPVDYPAPETLVAGGWSVYQTELFVAMKEAERQARKTPALDWVVCGGESGSVKKCRPMDLKWARSLLAECEAAGVPFFFKQTGAWMQVDESHPDAANAKAFPGMDGVFTFVHGGGSELLDGKEYKHWPENSHEPV